MEELTYPEAAGSQLGWSVDTVLVLGDAMAEPEYQFGMPADAQLAGDGRSHIYVADEEGSRVLENDQLEPHRSAQSEQRTGLEDNGRLEPEQRNTPTRQKRPT